MTAACAAAGAGAGVILFEKNEKPGKKLFITGKGRCNVTNDCDTADYFDHVLSGGKFLYSAVYGFDKDAVKMFFEENGCPLKTERGGRVFPVSDHSSDVIGTLKRVMTRRGVDLRTDSAVKSLLFDAGEDASGKKRKLVRGVKTADGKIYHADAVIIATGGLSYPSTGSTGDGHAFAREAGHTVTDLSPGLVPLVTKEDWVRELQGLSLRNVSLRTPSYSGFGEMLFTHFGISGPLVLTASSLYEEGTEMPVNIDLKPALTKEQLDARLIRELEANRNKQFGNAVSKLFPAKLAPVMVRLSGIERDKRAGEVTRTERERFGALIKALPLTVTGTRGYTEAIVTRGGVARNEIDPSTMESKLCEGLYFAGEVLDLDAETGGYNLQIAWSTGHLAGLSAAERSLR